MAAISITRTDGGLVGTVGGQRVELEVRRGSSARVAGESLGAPLHGYWNVESNDSTLDPVSIFLGEYDGQPVLLRSDVHLAALYSLRHADISGSIGDQRLQVRAAPVDAPAIGPSVVGVDGHFGEHTVTLFAAINGDLSGARISGVIGGERVDIHATRTELSGEYAAEPAMLPLLLVSLDYFM